MEHADTATPLIEGKEKLLQSLSPHSWRTIHPELLNKILRRIDEPEEKVRYYWVLKLVNEYGYDSKKIDINIPAGGGRNKSSIFADIVVFRDFERSEAFIVGEVKKAGDRNGVDGEQSASYARNLGAEYHLWSNKTLTKYWRTVKFPNKSEPIGNIPVWVGNEPLKQKIPKSEVLPPFRDETELRKVISQCHNLIYEKQGHDPAKSFDELTKLLFLKLYDEREVPDYYEFAVLSNDKPKDVAVRIRKLFLDGVTTSRYNDVFFSKFNKKTDTLLELDDFTIFKIVQLLQGYSLVNTTETIEGADIKGTVFEQMVGNTFRGGACAVLYSARNH
jgi:type I restriction enzyme M protein